MATTMNESGADTVHTERSIDYRPQAYEHGTYRMTQLKQITGGDGLAAGIANVNQFSTFEIPNKVVNFAKSQLTFDLSVDSTNNARTPDFFALGCPAIDRISLLTRGGIYLMDLVDFNYYTEAVIPYTTKIAEMDSKRVGFAGNGADDATAAALAYPVGLIQPGNGVLTAGVNPSLAVFVIGDAAAVDTGVTGNRRYNVIRASTMKEHRYVHDQFRGANAAAASVSALRYVLKFGELPHCLLGVDKDLFFGETLILNITWALNTQIGFQETRADGAYAAGLGGVSLSNLNLYLAVETNRMVAESVISKAQAGLALTIPYVYTNRYQTGAGASLQSIQIRINRGHGKSLLKIYHIPYLVANTQNLLYLHDVAVTTTSFYTTVDNDRMQDNVMIPSNYGHLPYIEAAVKGCAIDSSDSLNYNFVWIEDFSGAPTCDWKLTDTAEGGLPLSQERIWTLLHTQLAATAHRSFYVTQKTLFIAPNQIVVQ